MVKTTKEEIMMVKDVGAEAEIGTTIVTIKEITLRLLLLKKKRKLNHTEL